MRGEHAMAVGQQPLPAAGAGAAQLHLQAAGHDTTVEGIHVRVLTFAYFGFFVFLFVYTYFGFEKTKPVPERVTSHE